MNKLSLVMLRIVPLTLLALGCTAQNSPPPQQDQKAQVQDKEAKIQASLNKLDPADQKLAQEQKYCAVETENRLGAMGTPIKVIIKDQPVFLCCTSCEKAARKDPDRTLATAQKLKSRQQSQQ